MLTGGMLHAADAEPRHTEDRTYRNEFGIFGDVELLTEARPAFVRVDAPAAGRVDDNGMAERTFSGKTVPGAKKVVLSGHGRSVELPLDAEGNFRGALMLPADFNRYAFTLTAFDAENRAFDSRNVELNGSVIELRDGKLYVNGDQFVIRGINSETGIEWDNDRRQTRRRWLKMLGTYKQLGFNALRIEGVTEQQLNRTHQDRFARPGFPGDDVETGPELQLGLLNQRKIRDFHIDKHAEKISPETLFFKPEAGRKDLKIPRTRLSFPPCRRNRPGTAGRPVCSVPNRDQRAPIVRKFLRYALDMERHLRYCIGNSVPQQQQKGPPGL